MKRSSLDFEDYMATVSNNPEFSYWLCPENVFTNVGIFSKCQVSPTGWLARQRGELPIEWQWRLISWHDTSGKPAAPFPCTTQHNTHRHRLRQFGGSAALQWICGTEHSLCSDLQPLYCQPLVSIDGDNYTPPHTVSFPVPIQGLHDPQKSNSNDCLARMNI